MNNIITSTSTTDNMVLMEEDSLYKNMPSSPELTSSPELSQYRYIDDTLTTYDDFKNAKLSIKQLKEYCKKYKQRISGNKLELKERILTHLKKIEKAKIIQKWWRLCIIRKYNSARGPARFKRHICLNDTDFFTTESMRDIPMKQYISYRDIDDRVYGFNILSLFNLYKKANTGSDFKNPYNRNEIPLKVVNNMFKIIRLSKFMHENVKITIEPLQKISQSKKIELRAIELFQYIDNLGNYTDHRWFLSLGRYQTDLFIKELFDIWNYRSQITPDIKREICPPDGNPFQSIIVSYLFQKTNEELKEIALEIIENMIKRGNTVSYKTLGANYVLCALTLVSQQAAISLPWLYQSVAHH